MHLRLADIPQIESTLGEVISLAARDAALLAWLAIEGPTSRDRLAALLWPASSDAQARTTLRQRLFRLKKALGFDIATGSPTLQLAPGVSHDLAEASELLGDLALPDAPEIDAWLLRQREQRSGREHDALRAQAQAQEDAGDAHAALPVAQALLRMEPLSEASHQRVMRLHYLLGDRSAALQAFDACEQMLKHEVGTQPSGETLALLATIEQVKLAPPPQVRRAIPAAVLRPPRMVGRDREAALLQLAWASGDVAAVIGEAGMGKSRLLAEFIDAHPGVVRAAGRPGDGGVPFATLARLLRAIGERGASPVLTTDARHQLARVLPELGEAGSAFAEGHRLHLRRALTAYLQAAPGLAGLVLDDLHFADTASLEMLQTLVADAEPGGLRWALAFRPAEAGTPLLALQTALTEAARLMPVHVAPLDEAALAELVDQLGLGLNGAAIAAALRQRTGGNPLFVLETLKQAWVEQRIGQLAAGSGLPRPMSVERLIDSRIGQLSPGALALARVASIAGVDFTIGLAESVLGVGAMQFADALGELEAAQVLKGTQFAHDLVFDAVLRSVPGAIAEHTHAQVASWLEQREGEPARIARHWIDGRHVAQAIPWLGQAAANAALALRNIEQLAFLEQKARMESEVGLHEDAFATQLSVVELGADIDVDSPEAVARYDTLDALARTELHRLESTLRRVDLLVRRASDAPARELGQDLIRRAMRAGALNVAMQCRVVMVFIEWRGERLADALAHAQACEAWVQEHGEAATRGQLHAYMGALYARLGPITEAIAHHERAVSVARELGVPSYVAITLDNLAAAQMVAGQSRLARLRADEALLLAASHEASPLVTGGAWRTRALIDLRLGRFTDALHALGECRRIGGTAMNSPVLAATTDICEALCWSLLGQWSRVQRLVAQVNQVEGLFPHQLANCLRLRFLLGLAQGRCDVDLLDEAIGLLAQTEELRYVLLNLKAPTLPAAEGLALMESVRARMSLSGHGSHVLMAHVRSAQIAAEVDPALAARHARAALRLSESTDLGTHNAAELPLQCSRALFAAGEDRSALVVLQAGLEDLQRSARDHVPTEFRDSFLHRNPVNVALLALASRHGLDGSTAS